MAGAKRPIDKIMSALADAGLPPEMAKGLRSIHISMGIAYGHLAVLTYQDADGVWDSGHLFIDENVAPASGESK